MVRPSYWLPVILFLRLYSPAQSQSHPTLIGSRAMALAYATSCLEDEWSLFNNVAGLGKYNSLSTAFTYESYPAFKTFNRTAFALTIPAGILGTTGIGAYRFGDELYNEQLLAAGLSNSFGLASLGVKVNYVQYHAEGLGNARVFTVSFGGIAELSEHVFIGAHIVNINQPRISGQSDEAVPTALILGMGIKPSEKLFLAGEVEKDLAYSLLWKAAIEYKLNKKFIARTGVTIHPQAGYAGLGFRPKKFGIDYAFQYNATLGARHQASVTYIFKQKK